MACFKDEHCLKCRRIESGEATVREEICKSNKDRESPGNYVVIEQLRALHLWELGLWRWTQSVLRLVAVIPNMP